jgi:hypothetical protein
LKVVELNLAELAGLDDLLRAYPFKPYQRYRMISKSRQIRVLDADIRRHLESPGGTVFRVDDEAQTLAAVVYRDLDWETGFFGIPMGRLDYPLRLEGSERALELAVDASLEHCRGKGIHHVAARVDVADIPTVRILEDRGFRVMDALVTYIYRHKREAPREVKEMGVLREYEPRDRAQILEITREAYAGFQGRFHFDPHLSTERCTELYVEWARKCCAGEWAEHVLVTEDGQGYLHGWTSYRRIEPVSSVGGVEVHGGGLGACRRNRPGAYLGLLQAAFRWIHGHGAVTETQTQNYNFPTIRLYESLEQQQARAEYTLHAWLGPG